MHELSIVKDVVRKAEAIAREQNANRVVEVTLQQGSLSGLSPEVLRGHFAEAARGTVAEGARVEVLLAEGVTSGAQELTLVSVEVEVD
ncbi:MAG TPA: hydrogenase maturation nickel metallochaperone HypA [Dehalococcoidia bacterium]|nr:hydrogenase maturation nickel metallochaperone HypA [Dehalococcoidia bacterium]